MAYNYQKVNGPLGKDNSPGLKKNVLVAPRSWFDVLSVEVDPDGDTVGRVKITADHTFITGKGWVQLYTTLDTGQLTAEMVGDRDSKVQNPKVECKHPGSKEEILAFADAAKNDEFICLVQGLNNEWLQLGSDGLEALIMGNYDSGKVSGGYKGWTFTIESFGKIFLYEGTITMLPETSGSGSASV